MCDRMVRYFSTAGSTSMLLHAHNPQLLVFLMDWMQ
jgi:hypothetical protein